ELWETFPDFASPRLPSTRRVNVIGPDVAQHEGPDADEDVDEHLDRGGGAEHPTGLILHALSCVLRENERLVDAAGRNSGAIGFDCKSHPGTRHHRLMCKEGLRDER